MPNAISSIDCGFLIMFNLLTLLNKMIHLLLEHIHFSGTKPGFGNIKSSSGLYNKEKTP